MRARYHLLTCLIVFTMGCNMPETTYNTILSSKPSLDLNKTSKKAEEAFEFCKTNKYNTDFCILIDMSLHSGVNRFCIWDFGKQTMTFSCLVGNGCCDNQWNTDQSKTSPKFSNVPDSHCSSLGKYKIGERGYSNWGVHTKYLLHGLDSTNSNALQRTIVLHSWEVVSDDEVYPDGTPEGWGCPILSDNSFLKVDALLKNSKKPVLMWIYI